MASVPLQRRRPRRGAVAILNHNDQSIRWQQRLGGWAGALAQGKNRSGQGVVEWLHLSSPSDQPSERAVRLESVIELRGSATAWVLPLTRLSGRIENGD